MYVYMGHMKYENIKPYEDWFWEKNNFNLPIVGCDATALKTAARTDPSLYLMKGPIVQHKWGWADFERAMK